MTDRALIEQIKQRNQDAMVMLHQQYADLVFSIAYRILDDDLTAEEAVQDTFLKAWQSIAQFDDQRGSLVAWLIGISRNVAIDKVRQRGRYIKKLDDRAIDDNEEALFADLPDDWHDNERISHLRLAIQALPPEQSQVIDLSYYGGLSQSEIAEFLTLPLGTVKTRMRLGMQKLREAWIQEEI
jgi:RNA polymerase sigma-70 factor, ECF subfamily